MMKADNMPELSQHAKIAETSAEKLMEQTNAWVSDFKDV